MAKIEIPVRVYMDNLDEMLNEIRQLQTYKLGEGNEKTLVGCDDVVNVFRKHLRTKVGTSSDPQWIPISERLPDIHDEVLVTARGEVSIAWLYVDGKWRSNDMPQPMFKDITAWMPLPEPYKEGKNGKAEI